MPTSGLEDDFPRKIGDFQGRSNGFQGDFHDGEEDFIKFHGDNMKISLDLDLGLEFNRIS